MTKSVTIYIDRAETKSDTDAILATVHDQNKHGYHCNLSFTTNRISSYFLHRILAELNSVKDVDAELDLRNIDPLLAQQIEIVDNIYTAQASAAHI